MPSSLAHRAWAKGVSVLIVTTLILSAGRLATCRLNLPVSREQTLVSMEGTRIIRTAFVPFSLTSLQPTVWSLSAVCTWKSGTVSPTFKFLADQSHRAALERDRAGALDLRSHRHGFVSFNACRSCIPSIHLLGRKRKGERASRRRIDAYHGQIRLLRHRRRAVR